MKSKAIFLLVIFLLNTVVGFGCALGMEVDFHDPHHSYKVDNHSDKDHEHHHAIGKSTQISGQHVSQEDLCCKSLVNDLIIQSKQIPESIKFQAPVPIISLPDFSHSLLAPLASVKLAQSVYADHRERPPNQDIRIAIQSFQI
ncbi:hypothetical protein [Pedobacter gandavensis]|uniref:hypothetical protein n=1 Tax=Pedobacter gandavensis TaxID=2679963 RepID=UPI00292E03B8|nr:hypothetical protein [Pedobacter gandavensis]